MLDLLHTLSGTQLPSHLFFIEQMIAIGFALFVVLGTFEIIAIVFRKR